MIWGLLVFSLVLLVGAVVSAFYEGSARWLPVGKGPDSARRAIEILAATFMGISAAILATTYHERNLTIENLCHVLDVARLEVSHSAKVIRAKRTSRVDRGRQDDRRLILQNPATVLHTLLQMPSFLENVAPPIASELAGLNTALRWRATPTPDYGRRTKPNPVLPGEGAVLKRLDTTIELLDQQSSILCSVPTGSEAR